MSADGPRDGGDDAPDGDGGDGGVRTDGAGEDVVATNRRTFEDIDWTAIDASSRRVRPLTALWWGSLAVLFGGLLVDAYWRLAPELPDAGVLGLFARETGGAFSFPVVGTVAPLTWLYALTLLFAVFKVVVPLARERRMTMYYWREFRKNRLAVVSLVWLGVIFAIGTVGPLFLSTPEVAPLEAYQPPAFMSVDSGVPVSCVGETVDGRCQGTWQHPFGTTAQGKDILVSTIYGMKISMQVGLIGAFLIILVSSAVGLLAAYSRGWVDEILMRYVDIQITFPTFFLYLLITFMFGGSLFNMIVIFGLFGWGSTARIVRSEALQRREEEYVLAAENTGAGTWSVIRRHLLPNVSNSVITAVSLTIPSLILFEAALAFLGLGDPTIPSWGEVIADGRRDLDRAAWISTIPGVFLFFTILAFNFVGDALRDALDPRNVGGED